MSVIGKTENITLDQMCHNLAKCVQCKAYEDAWRWCLSITDELYKVEALKRIKLENGLDQLRKS